MVALDDVEAVDDNYDDENSSCWWLWNSFIIPSTVPTVDKRYDDLNSLLN